MCAERVYLLPKKNENSTKQDSFEVLKEWIDKQPKNKEMKLIWENFIQSPMKLNEDFKVIYPDSDMPGSSIYEILEYSTKQKKKKPLDYNMFEQFINQSIFKKIKFPMNWKKIE
jgi:hypothetical protein